MDGNDHGPDHLKLSDATPQVSATSLHDCDTSFGDDVQSHEVIMEYTGKEYSFIDEIPDDYICSVCSKIFTEPHLAECCGHHYCLSCLEKWLKTKLSQTCPFCRSPNFNHIQDKSLERKIRELRVTCTNAHHSCDWIGTLFDIQTHLNSCIHAHIECGIGCGIVLPRREINSHEQNDCKLRLDECAYCSNMFTAESLAGDHFLTCPMVLVTCDKCEGKVKRCEVQSHLEHECPVVLKCPFADVGCSAIVPRDSVEEHVATCKEKYLVKAFQKLTMEVASLKNETQSLRDERDQLKTELKHVTKGVKISHYNSDFLRAENRTLRTTVLNELEFLHDCSHPPALLALECLKTQLKEEVLHLQPDQRVATFRITQYKERKFNNEIWYSPPFYISQGYKMCMAIHLNGIGAGKSTHTSLHLHQMKGVYDGELAWPYFWRSGIEISLMCQEPNDKRKNRKSNESPKQSPVISRPSFTFGKSKTLPGRLREEAAVPVIQEVQEMQVASYLSRVRNSSTQIGPPISKLELFCTQQIVDSVVCGNSIVIQCCLKASSPFSFCDVELKSGWIDWEHNEHTDSKN